MPILAPSELADLRESCREVLDDLSPMSTVRAGVASGLGYDAETWRHLVDLGWLTALVPESLGGMGWGFSEAAVILSELGRRCVAGPYLGTGILAPVALSSLAGTEASDRLLKDLIASRRIATVALAMPGSGSDDPTARRSGSLWQLRGRVEGVPDLPHASLVLVPACTEEGAALFALDLAQSSEAATAQEAVDQTRSIGTLHLDKVELTPGALLAQGRDAERAITMTRESFSLAIACDAAAGTRRVHELAHEYSMQRRQFGRAIGGFQVIKHRLADQYLLAECAEVSAQTAAAAMDRGSAELAVSTAKAYATDAYCRVAHDAVLVHGAVGFTWEHDLHLYLKRALLDRELAAPPSWHRLRALTLRANAL